MRYFDELARFDRDGFEIIVDKTWEDSDPWDHLSECFDDRKQLYADIDNCKYDWFMLRVRAMIEGAEMGSEYLGGCLYENAEKVLTDGTVDDLLIAVLEEARQNARALKEKLALIVD
jgi:hypothetical protein